MHPRSNRRDGRIPVEQVNGAQKFDQNSTPRSRCSEGVPRGNALAVAGSVTGSVGSITKRLEWCYGVTTVPSRSVSHLPKTLDSLRKGGFDRPHLFVDGATDGSWWANSFGLDVTCRGGIPVRVAGNWILSLYELYYRNPLADRYALFQDDLIMYRNTRDYLNTFLPEKGYLNLYTMESNVTHFTPHGTDGKPSTGWYSSNQWGKSAIALVFDRQGVIELLCSRHLARRPSNRDKPSNAERWYCKIDGGISAAMSGNDRTNPTANGGAGYLEYVHYPTLVQHTGHVSSRKEAEGARPQPIGQGFLGEEFNARNFGMGKMAEGKIRPMTTPIMHISRDM